jgi:hypothetical protein
MMLSAYDYEREREKANAWDDFRREIGDLLYKAACKGKDCPRPNNDDELALWNLSEDARSLEYNPARICDFLHTLEEWIDTKGVAEIQDRLLALLDNHFGVSPQFFRMTTQPYETARSYKVPS